MKLDFSNIPIKFESTKNGTLEISDIRYDYAGGKDTIEITVHNDNSSLSIVRKLIYYFSSMGLWFWTKLC